MPDMKFAKGRQGHRLQPEGSGQQAGSLQAAGQIAAVNRRNRLVSQPLPQGFELPETEGGQADIGLAVIALLFETLDLSMPHQIDAG
jgi:hypothetical protein